MAKNHANNDKKKQSVLREPTAQELSEFAYLPTSIIGLNENKPYGSTSYKYMKGLLMQRVSPARYVHSLSVAKTARKIARAYGYDPHIARMAGLLHDWDKALSPKRLADRVEHYQIKVDKEVVSSMPWVLHGMTAAAVLAEEAPQFDEELYSAIAHHTVGAIDMSPLDMIVFVADKVEPTHEVSAYKHLYKQIGDITLDELFFGVLKESMAYLVRSEKPITKESVQVWNWYCQARKSKENKE